MQKLHFSGKPDSQTPQPTVEASRDAHALVTPRKPRQTELILSTLLSLGPSTSEAIHAGLVSEGCNCTVNTVRARLSEMKSVGTIVATGERSAGACGTRITVWTIPPIRAAPAKRSSIKHRLFAATTPRGKGHTPQPLPVTPIGEAAGGRPKTT